MSAELNSTQTQLSSRLHVHPCSAVPPHASSLWYPYSTSSNFACNLTFSEGLHKRAAGVAHVLTAQQYVNCPAIWPGKQSLPSGLTNILTSIPTSSCTSQPQLLQGPIHQFHSLKHNVFLHRLCNSSRGARCLDAAQHVEHVSPKAKPKILKLSPYSTLTSMKWSISSRHLSRGRSSASAGGIGARRRRRRYRVRLLVGAKPSTILKKKLIS